MAGNSLITYESNLLQFNIHIKKAEWNEAKQNWTVTEESGNTHTANAIISAVGALHQPLRPIFKNQVFKIHVDSLYDR